MSKATTLSTKNLLPFLNSRILAVFGLLIVVSGATLFFSPQTALANTRLTNVSRVIHSNGDVDAVTVYCTIGKAYTEYLYNDTVSYMTGIFGLPTPRHYCATGTIAFDGFNMNTLLDGYNGVDNWNGYVHTPMEWGVVDTTGEGGCSSEISCGQYNVTGAWEGYNNSIYIPYVEGYNDGYYVPTTIYYAGGGPTWTTTPYNRTWSNSADGDGSGNYVANTSSRIDSVTPANGAVLATTTTNTLGYTGYLNSADLNTASEVLFHVENGSCSFAGSGCLGATGFHIGILGNPNVVFYNNVQPLSSSGTFSFSTTTQGLPFGKYYMTITIRKGGFCLFSFCFNTRTNIIATSTEFLVATTTKADVIKAKTKEFTNAMTASGDNALAKCTLTSFDFFGCMSDLITVAFAPEPQSLEYFATSLRDGALSHFPLAYISRISEILNATSTQDLPTLSYTFSTTSPAVPVGLAGANIHFDPWQYMATSTNPLTDIKSIGGNLKPLDVWDILGTTINSFIYLTLVFLIFGELISVGFIGNHHHLKNKKL